MPADAVRATLWPRLSALIAEKTGLHFPPERQQDLERGISDAAPELGFPTSEACADWLLSTPLTGAQLHTLASHLTIGETYFFRERQTLDALAERILPDLIAHRRDHGKRLRLWSAACSTGEEPYTLAILLRQLLPDWEDWNITILATDINGRSLQKAARGVYGEWSFRTSSPEFRERYFKPVDNGRFELAPELRRSVTFVQLNLAQDNFPSLVTSTNAMDVILCRNILIYFTAAQMQRLVQKLHDSLLDDAWLAVSPSECSQTLFSQFATVNFPGVILYQKQNRQPQQTSAPVTSWTANGPATPVVAPTSNLATYAPTPAGERRPPPLASNASTNTGADLSLVSATAEPPPGQGPLAPANVFREQAQALANQGQLAASLTWSERWIAADKLDPAAHHLHAMILQELGDRPASRRSLQRAIYLKSDFAIAHFALGMLARSEGRGTEADRHLHNALRLLQDRPPDQVVPESDGLTAGRLTEIISALSATNCSSQ